MTIVFSAAWISRTTPLTSKIRSFGAGGGFCGLRLQPGRIATRNDDRMIQDLHFIGSFLARRASNVHSTHAPDRTAERDRQPQSDRKSGFGHRDAGSERTGKVDGAKQVHGVDQEPCSKARFVFLDML